jgi:hypothetical protein
MSVMVAIEAFTVMVGAIVPSACTTVTPADWVAVAYALAVEASGVYVALRVFLPTGSAPAGKLNVVVPEARVC